MVASGIKGVEWMIPLYELSMLVLPIAAFVKLFSRLKRGNVKKHTAIL